MTDNRSPAERLTSLAKAAQFNMAEPQDYSDPEALRVISNRDFVFWLNTARLAGMDDERTKSSKQDQA